MQCLVRTSKVLSIQKVLSNCSRANLRASSLTRTFQTLNANNQKRKLSLFTRLVFFFCVLNEI
jgi:hypothetical protein